MDEKEQERAWSSSGSDGQTPFHLDESVPARHVSFQTLRNLLVQIGRSQPVAYADIVDRPSEALAAILVTAGGQVMGRSTRYHHLNALKILGLTSQVHKQYILSSYGEAIARLHTDDSAPLSAEILGLFRQAVRSCDLVRRNFLVLFTGKSDLDPWQFGAPVSLNPIPGQRSCELNCSMWPGRLRLSANITSADFDRIVRRYVPLGQPIYGDTISISIPLLLYRLCPAERVSLATAKFFLREWLEQNAEYAFAEAPSYSILQSGRHRRASSLEVWRKQQDAFLKVDNRVYSRLLISQTLWTAKGEYEHADKR